MINLIKHHYKIIVVALLVIMLAVEITGAMQKSQIIDEAPHIAAGYSYLTTNDFTLNPEHPPLIKMLSAFPLLFMNLDPIEENPGWQRNEQWSAGQYLLYNNRIDHFWLLFWARLPIMLLSILLGLIIFKWSKDLFGPLGGLIALLFYAFDPTVIAHSRWITTDLGIAAFMIAALYFFSRFMRKPTLLRAVIFSLVFGLALVAKFSAVILIPLIIMYLIIAKLQGWPRNTLPPDEMNKAFSIKKLVLFTAVIGFLVVWATYGFEVKVPYSDPEVSAAFAPGKSQQEFDKPWLKFINIATDTETGLGQLTENLAKKIPIPAFTYAKGFAVLANHNYWGHTSYLLGNHSDVGWWYYFIIAFLVKTPLVTLLLTFLLLALFIKWLINTIKKSVRQKPEAKLTQFFVQLKDIRLDWYIIILTPTLYLIWTLTSKLNLGVRHLLPVYPFIFVMIGWLTRLAIKKYARPIKSALAIGLVFYVAMSLSIYPNYLSYFNVAVGGPDQGHKYLLDSNIDWGQELYALKNYIDRHNLGKIYFHYFGTAYPEAYGIEHQSPPTNDQIKYLPNFKGTVAISVSGLFSKNNEYSWLLEYEPVEKLGYSVWIYNIE